MRRQIICLLLVWTSLSVANGQHTLAVAQDGSGDFSTIQIGDGIDKTFITSKAGMPTFPTALEVYLNSLMGESIPIGSKAIKTKP